MLAGQIFYFLIHSNICFKLNWMEGGNLLAINCENKLYLMNGAFYSWIKMWMELIVVSIVTTRGRCVHGFSQLLHWRCRETYRWMFHLWSTLWFIVHLHIHDMLIVNVSRLWGRRCADVCGGLWGVDRPLCCSDRRLPPDQVPANHGVPQRLAAPPPGIGPGVQRNAG